MKRDIDEIIDSVKRRFPEVEVHQLQVTHPADDNGIWYFYFSGNDDEIQIESWNGMCPFIVESNRNDVAGNGITVDEVVQMICEHLLSLKIPFPSKDDV